MRSFHVRHHRTALTAAVLGALTAASFHSVQAAAADREMPVYTLDDVVVTASRTEQSVKEAPASVEIVTREDIDRLGAETLAQALALTVGLDVTENGMVGNQAALRGMSTNQTLILIDGRRIRTEDTSQTANYYELQRINMDDVERIEIVRGSVSSLYGSEALGGVINIIRKHPEKKQVGVSVDWTSQQKDGGVSVDFGKTGKWAWRTSFKVSDVRERGAETASNQYGRKYYFNLDGRMDIAQRKHLDFFFDYMNEDLDQKSEAVTQTGGNYRSNPGTVDYNHKRYSTGLRYAGEDRRGTYEMQVYYTRFDKKQETHLRSNGVLSDFDDMIFHSYIADGKRTWNVGADHKLTFGGEYRKEEYESTRIDVGGGHTVTRNGISKTESKADLDYAALYLQDEWRANKRLYIVPSVRWDHNNKFGNKVTAQLGTTYRISDRSRVKMNVGSAYRAPTASELYMHWDHVPAVARMRAWLVPMQVHIDGNPNLKPEKAVNFDLSFEAEGKRSAGKITYFHNKVDDLINLNTISRTIMSSTPPPHPIAIRNIGHYENVDKATLQGIEFEGRQRLGDQFTLRSTYTYLDAKNDMTGDRLIGRARHKLSLQIIYDDFKHGWSGVLWNDWLSDYYYAAEGRGNAAVKKNTSATVLNLVINKKINDHLSAYFGVNNLLNEENTTLYYDGRIWRGGINMTF